MKKISGLCCTCSSLPSMATLTVLMATLLVAPTYAQSLEKVSIRLDFLAAGYHSAIFLAQERGYYREQGLDVDIQDGKGSLITIQDVASGNDLIGLATASTIALAAGKGVPVVAVAGVMQKSPEAILMLKGSGISRPKDVEGKRWGFIPGDSGARIFEAVAALHKVDLTKVTKVQLSFATRNTSLLQGNVDFITAWESPDSYKIAKQKPIDPPIVFGDVGVNVLGSSIFVTKDTATNRAQTVRRFLVATTRAFSEGQRDPAALVDAVMKARPSTDRDILAEEIKHLPEFTHTKNTVGQPFGWMAAQDWDQTRDILRGYFELPASLRITEVYTNDLLPQK
jgi:NitT/TauT family transport system substrate-binding protein